MLNLLYEIRTLLRRVCCVTAHPRCCLSTSSLYFRTELVLLWNMDVDLSLSAPVGLQPAAFSASDAGQIDYATSTSILTTRGSPSVQQQYFYNGNNQVTDISAEMPVRAHLSKRPNRSKKRRKPDLQPPCSHSAVETSAFGNWRAIFWIASAAAVAVAVGSAKALAHRKRR